MPDLDKRGRALEEEYFHRKNQEAIEKLQQKLKVSQEAKAAASGAMTCPRCGDPLKEGKNQEVAINSCEQCGGLWLDSGELEQLNKAEDDGFFTKLWNGLL